MSLGDAERDEQRELLETYFRTRDLAVRDQLVAANLRLALHLARRFPNRGVSLDDLEQVASLGLLRAIDRFDPGRGLEFSTFATPTILGEPNPKFDPARSQEYQALLEKERARVMGEADAGASAPSAPSAAAPTPAPASPVTDIGSKIGRFFKRSS